MMMRTRCALPAIGSVFVVLLVMAFPLAGGEARVVHVDGHVELRVNGEWVAAEAGMLVPVGATLSTGFGATARLAVPGAELDVLPLTRLRIDELIDRPELRRTGARLDVGRVRGEVQTEGERPPEFELRGPIATAAVRGTSFEFDGRNLRVFSGAVELRNAQEHPVSVAAGESAVTREDGELTSGAAVRERTATVRVSEPVVDDLPPPDPPRRDEVTTGTLRVEWE